MGNDKNQRSAGDATSKPDYGESGQPKPIAPNKTDAGGVETGYQANAVDKDAMRLAEARRIVEAADREMEAAGVKPDGKGRLPQVLKSNLDVRRGEKVYRIPAGAVVTDTELTDEEFDHALALGIIGEATMSDIRADQLRKQQGDTDEKARLARREAVGVSPKGATDQPPAGAQLVSDLGADAAARERQAVADREAMAGRSFEPTRPASLSGTGSSSSES